MITITSDNPIISIMPAPEPDMKFDDETDYMFPITMLPLTNMNWHDYANMSFDDMMDDIITKIDHDDYKNLSLIDFTYYNSNANMFDSYFYLTMLTSNDYSFDYNQLVYMFLKQYSSIKSMNWIKNLMNDSMNVNSNMKFIYLNDTSKSTMPYLVRDDDYIVNADKMFYIPIDNYK